ncbi:MAG: glycosyltransferase domain-containing protein [Bacteroidota bacterium]
MKVLTVATNLQDYHLRNFLIPSCGHLGYELIILYYASEWSSHRMKDKIIVSYLETLDPNEIVLFTDAYDTLFLSTSDALLKTFNNFNSSLLFSSEINCWPEPELCEVYARIHEKKAFLNSGAYIGRVSHIVNLLKKNPTAPSHILSDIYKIDPGLVKIYDQKYMWSNQYYWTLLYLSLENRISLDFDSKMFLALGTALPFFQKNFKDFRSLGTQSLIYRKELNRIQDIFSRMQAFSIAHVHFNNPVLKVIFKNLHKQGTFPQWVKEILSKKDVSFPPPEIIEIG